MNLTKGSIVWPAIAGKPDGTWLWGARSDLFWIAGGASMLFALVVVPLTIAVPVASGALVTAFLHLGAVCNYPHYVITYALIVRERERSPSSWRWLLASLPVVLGVGALGVVRHDVIGAFMRVYLTWSAYHYAAQHFGIASMYQARAKRALAPRDKRLLQVAFVAVAAHVMVLLNLEGGLGDTVIFGAKSAAPNALLLPRSFAPAALAAAFVGLVAYASAEVSHRRRTGFALGTPARLLFATNVLWFVLPFLRLPGGAAPGYLAGPAAAWIPFAVPFFHCAQYLGVCGWRRRTTGEVKPIYYFMALVVIGLALFEGTAWLLPRVSPIAPNESVLLVLATLNVHHFFLDGLMWKARRRPAT